MIANACALFVGLTFNQMQADALARSAAVQAAYATAREREASLHLARIGALPSATADYSLVPQAGVPGQTIAQHSLTLGAGITLSDLLSQAAAVRSAAADLLAAQRDEQAAELLENERTTSLYYGALDAVAVEALRASALDGARSDLRTARARFAHGDAPQLDVIRAQVQVYAAQADLARASADRDDALAALSAETGIATAAMQTGQGICEVPDRPIDPNRAALLAVARRPEIASLEAQVRARSADVSAAREGGFPTIAASAGYQRGVDTGQPVSGAAASVHIDVPLGNPANDRAAIARARYDATRAQLDETVRNVGLQAASAARNASASEAAWQASERALAAARRALDAVELGYREGASSSLDVADARRTYVQTSIDALASTYARQRAYALLQLEVP